MDELTLGEGLGDATYNADDVVVVYAQGSLGLARQCSVTFCPF